MSTTKDIVIPDIGTDGEVSVIEVTVKPGEKIAVDQQLITLESEKASMEIPSPEAGIIESVLIKVGDKVKTGSVILKLTTEQPQGQNPVEQKIIEPIADKQEAVSTTSSIPPPASESSKNISDEIHASPIVRRLAREFGIDLNAIAGTGRKNRIQKEDLQVYVKNAMQGSAQSNPSMSGFPAAPVVDFTKFGNIETKPLSKIKKYTATNLHRNWVLVPHVTQFDEADITDLEAFRKSQQQLVEKQNIKLTFLTFLMKAVVATLKDFPQFNASLDSSGDNLILKKFYHIGVAVDTPDGLVVPVIRDVDKKGIIQLAKELTDMSSKARNKQLLPNDMQGSSFTISSLGGIGGTAFTPIVNLPDVAILGVSKSSFKPLYQNGQFVPRLMLPLSLSYDHRVIDGAEGARFIVQLTKYLSDIRQILM